MATVNASGDPVLVIFEVPANKLTEFNADLIAAFHMEPGSTNVAVANRIAEEIREIVRRHRRVVAKHAAIIADPGTIDFT